MSPVASAAGPGLTVREFFDSVRAGAVRVQRCAACGALAVPAKAVCPACQARSWEPAPLAGTGDVQSFTIIRVPPRRLAAEAPYAVVVVRMTEGVSLLGRLTGVPVEEVRVGLPVQIVTPAEAVDPPVVTFGRR